MTDVVEDTPRPDSLYQPAGGVRFGYQASRFLVAGMEIDEAGCTLRVIIQAKDDPNWVRIASVSLPIGVQEDDLVVGTPKISYEAE